MTAEQEKIDFEDEFNIYNLLKRLWDDRKLFIIIVTLFAVGSIIYSLVVSHEYEVTAIIQPADATDETTIKDTSPVMGFALTGYSHLPVINGIMITLKSDSFLELVYRKYENEEKLFKKGLKKIDEGSESADFKAQLKRYEALKILHKIIKFTVNTDHNTIVLTVRLEDKVFAYELMNYLLESLRDYIRTQNINNLEDDIKFYQELTEKSQDPRIQQIIEQKLTEKLQKKFVLSSNVFTVVDRPFIPAKRVFPKRSVIVIITTIIGGFLAVMIISLKPTMIKIFNIIKSKK